MRRMRDAVLSAHGCHLTMAPPRWQPQHMCAQGGGGNPFANMGNLMENMKKAQELVQVGAFVTCAGSLW